MAIRALTADDVDTYRTIRLEALQADPDAFGSTYARELAFDPQDWLDRLNGRDDRSNMVWIDEASGETRGVVTLGHTPAEGHQIFGMWVRDSARGCGVAGELLGAAIAHARRAGATQVKLAVKRDNTAAISLYERHGFARNGSVVEADDSCCVGELEMRLSL